MRKRKPVGPRNRQIPCAASRRRKIFAESPARGGSSPARCLGYVVFRQYPPPASPLTTIDAMGFPFDDLNDAQFEDIVVQAMRKLFGQGVQGFATGPDGGRDARFHGTAECFPSNADPWSGITIGQAKHTNDTNRHFSDASFSGDAKSSVLSKELVRLEALVAAKELTNYILFSNRRLGGVIAPQLIKRIANETSIPPQQIHLAGIEYLNGILRQYPEVLSLAQVDPVDGPLLVSSYDLAELILVIAQELGSVAPSQRAAIVDRVPFDEKNEINSMSPEFAEQLMDRYLRYEKQIREFLADPENEESLRYYEAAVEEFQLNIVAKRKDHQSFDDVFNHLVNVLVGRDAVLGGQRSLVRAMLFYMYWHCDIGDTPGA